MAVGFDSRSQLLDWDGERWAYETFPAAPDSRKPLSALQPRPASSSPVSAAPTSTPRPSATEANAKAAAAGPAAAAAELLARGLAFRGDARMSGSTAQALLECHYSVHGAFLRGSSTTTTTRNGNGSSTDGSSTGISSRSLSSVGGSMDGDQPGTLPRPQRPGPRSRQPPPPALAPTSSPSSPAVPPAARATPSHWPPLLHSVGSGRLSGIPAVAVHGQLDFVCPATTAYELCRAWPELRLRLVPGAGHSMYDPAITHELVEATRLLYDAAAARYYGGSGDGDAGVGIGSSGSAGGSKG